MDPVLVLGFLIIGISGIQLVFSIRGLINRIRNRLNGSRGNTSTIILLYLNMYMILVFLKDGETILKDPSVSLKVLLGSISLVLIYTSYIIDKIGYGTIESVNRYLSKK